MASNILNLMNVGKATYKDLCLLGITNLDDLAKADPDDLYEHLQKITGRKQDICVLDIFNAIIHEAKTGEKRPWWEYSKLRKSNK